MLTDGINTLLSLPAGRANPTQEAEAPREVKRPETPPVELAQRKDAIQKAAAEEAEKREVEKLTEKQVREMTRVLNESAKLFNISIRFRLEEDINRIIVTVIDKNTDEEIRQIPPQELVQLAKRLEQLEGVLFNTTA